MSAYKLYHDGVSVIRKSDGALIPFDLGNRDYVEFLAWLDKGNKADVPDPDPELAARPTPTVEDLQAQLAAIADQLAALQS